MKKLYLFSSLLVVYTAKSQVGIGNTSPKAQLDITASSVVAPTTTDGLLIPRVTAFPTPVTVNQNGMLVFLSTAFGSNPVGFYYYDFPSLTWKWIASASNFWTTSGNSATVDGTNFIGTTDNVPLNFKVNSTKAGRIGLTGQTFFGLRSGTVNTSNESTGIGYKALDANTTGRNTALGFETLSLATTANYNAAFGDSALKSNTGNNNTAIGAFSALNNTTGTENTALGVYSMLSNTTGSFNTAVGNSALLSNIVGGLNTAVGFGALQFSKVDNNTAVGFQASYLNDTGTGNVALGFQASNANKFGNENTALGFQSLYLNTASQNTAVGFLSLYGNTTGNQNTAVGRLSLYTNTTGNQNTAMGFNSLLSNTTGFGNTGVGRQSLFLTTTGYYNTAIGTNSLDDNTIGKENTACGSFSLLRNISGNNNTSVGNSALNLNTTGSFNTATGHFSLLNNIGGNNNSSFGTESGKNIISGFNNTAVGYKAYENGDYNNSTGVGANSVVTASNMVRLGDDFSVSTIGGRVAFTVFSDGRFKKDIQENVPGLKFIEKLRPVTYFMDNEAIAKFRNTPTENRNFEGEKISGKVLRTGFIAQEVEKAAQAVNFDFDGVDKPKNDKDNYGLRYAEFVVPLVKSVQELNVIIVAQAKKNQELQDKIRSQELELKQTKESLLQNFKNLEERFLKLENNTIRN
jgi:trimeric autotransporter adhesin